ARRGAFRPRLEALEDRCLLSASALDTTFGSGGLVTGPSAQVSDTALPGAPVSAVVVQPDGKIVTGGYLTTANKSGSISDFALDTTFGSGGIVLTNVESDQQYSNTVGAFAVAIDGSGNIDVAGTANPSSIVNTGDEFALARYTAKGTLDPAFGGTGMVVTPQF